MCQFQNYFLSQICKYFKKLLHLLILQCYFFILKQNLIFSISFIVILLTFEGPWQCRAFQWIFNKINMLCYSALRTLLENRQVRSMRITHHCRNSQYRMNAWEIKKIRSYSVYSRPNITKLTRDLLTTG